MARTAGLRPIRGRGFGRTRALTGTGVAAAVLVPLELALRRVSRRGRPRLPWLFHRALARSLGIHVVVHGRPAQRRGVLFVVNHLSWADIPVLGSRILGAFVAKSEVAAWGPVGFLSTLARTVYVERERRQATGAARNAIALRARRGRERHPVPRRDEQRRGRRAAVPSRRCSPRSRDRTPATSSSSRSASPTRASTACRSRAERLPEVAWIGDTALVPHLMAFMSLGRVRAEIAFHPAVRMSDFADRKALAQHCQTVVADG